MPDPTFTNCHCPTCKRSLHDVPITTSRCALCNQPLQPDRVWLTRRYPGVIMLPGWFRAFGWPFLIILAGLAFLLWQYHWTRSLDIRIPSAFFAIGIVYFFVKLSTND